MADTILSINTESNIVVVSTSTENNDVVTQNVLIQTTPDVQIVSPQMSLGTSYINVVDVPSSSTSQGAPGEIRFDSNFIYLCVLNNLWKKIQLQDL